MASLRDIRRRIVSVKNTQQITSAMKMVAAAKLRRAQLNQGLVIPFYCEPRIFRLLIEIKNNLIAGLIPYFIKYLLQRQIFTFQRDDRKFRILFRRPTLGNGHIAQNHTCQPQNTKYSG